MSQSILLAVFEGGSAIEKGVLFRVTRAGLSLGECKKASRPSYELSWCFDLLSV